MVKKEKAEIIKQILNSCTEHRKKILENNREPSD